jgi:hypothetical protein
MQPGPYAPTAAPPRPASDQPIRPAKSWFVVAALIAVVGIIAAVVVLVRGISSYADRVDDFDRADLPATFSVEITSTGGYSIYHEYDGASDDFGWSPDPVVTVTDPSGAVVDLDDYVGSITYSASGHEGEGLYTFDADETGTYEVTAEGEPGDGIAVGRGIGSGLVAAIVGSLALGLLAVIAGVVVAIVVGVKRSGNRRALMPPAPFSGWGPPPPPGWGAPPGYGPPPGGAGGHGAVPAGSPGAYGSPVAPPPPPPPPPPRAPAPPPPAPADSPSDSPAPSDAPPSSGSPGAADTPPSAASRAPGTSLAMGVHGSHRARSTGPAVADPPSLRAPVDWARSDLPLPWSTRR